jgi:DNA-binding MarR family transcriptional regulator/N-acetylglutamate synthase-like GNAT family acetyltransferase
VSTDAIHQVRQFNRTVSQRIGALDEAYLASGRSLGASRVLWDVDPDGSDARSIRAHLGLDSGYLSRLLRSLEGEGLITVQPHPNDLRVRIVRLTDAGRAERAELDRKSNEMARSLLASLDDERQRRLLAAMATVERLLVAGMVELQLDDPGGAAAEFCIDSYFNELASRFDDGFDPNVSIPADATELVEPHGALVIARLHGQPVGCGALKFHGIEPAEIKRMWVAGDARGLGVGRRLLIDLEQRARMRGVSVVRLETNRALAEAINLYRSSGYVEVPAFNDEPYAHHWFEKHLSSHQSPQA